MSQRRGRGCALATRATLFYVSCVSLAVALPHEPAQRMGHNRIDAPLKPAPRLPGPGLAGLDSRRIVVLRGGTDSDDTHESSGEFWVQNNTFQRSGSPTTRAKEKALLNAAVHDDLQAAKDLILEGVDVNCEDYDQRTPLHLAAAEGHLPVLILLLKRGADPHAKDRFGHAPFHDALRGKHNEAAALLETAMSDTALLGKARAMISRILTSLVGGGSAPEDANANAPLSIARLPSFTESLAHLAGKKYPLPPNVEEDREKAKRVQDMCEAASVGDLGLIQQIVQEGTPINSYDYDRRTPLHLAAAEGQNHVILYLLSNGADARRRDRFGNLPYDDARREDHVAAADLLLNHMTHGTLAGRARTMYTQLLSRDHVRFSPAAMGEMLSRHLHSHAIAFDTENHARGQIIEYDPAFLSVFGWFRKLQGTIFMMPVIYFQAVVLIATALMYSKMCHMPTKENMHPAFPVLKGQAFGVSVVGGLLGFLLALFNSNGLDRWWQTRLTLGRVMAKLCDFGVMVATYVQNPEHKDECNNHRLTLVRWINLVHILIYRQARNVHDLSDLVYDTRYEPVRVWMTEEEWGLLQGRLMTKENGIEEIRKVFERQIEMRGAYGGADNKPTTLFFAAQDLVPVKNKLVGRSIIVLYWMERLLSQIARDGLLESSRHEALWKMQECLSEIRGAILCLFTYLYCKIPYIYAHILTCMVKLYLLVIALVAGSSVHLATTRMERILPLLLVLVANFVYEGIMQIHVRLWNPLGFDINSFPITKYMEFVWKTTHQLLEDDKIMLPSNIRPVMPGAVGPGVTVPAPVQASAKASVPASATPATASPSKPRSPAPAAAASMSEAPSPPPPHDAGGKTSGGGVLLD